MAILCNADTRLIVQGMGRMGRFHAGLSVEYGTQVVGGVHPGKGGTTIDGIPVFDTVEQAVGETGADASVDPATCEATGEGWDEVCVTWTDPSFDPDQRAFYYARVVEIPTCRWSTRVCNSSGIDCRDPASVREGYEACCDTDFPRSTQERAWSSPLWRAPVAAPTPPTGG